MFKHWLIVIALIFTLMTWNSIGVARASSVQPYDGFFAGAWAQYNIKSYDDTGALESENPMKYSVEDSSYNGVPCWLLNFEMQMTEGSDTTKMVMTFWMEKSNLEGVHVKTQMYTNDVLTFEHEGDITPSDEESMPTGIDFETVTTQETITVPAGTFNCHKTTITDTISGKTSVSSSWYSQTVPIIGLVKIETTYDGVLQSVTELLAVSDVIPEFPSWTPLLIMLVAVAVLGVTYRRKLNTPKS
jgi:hypothetical protein